MHHMSISGPQVTENEQLLARWTGWMFHGSNSYLIMLPLCTSVLLYSTSGMLTATVNEVGIFVVFMCGKSCILR